MTNGTLPDCSACYRKISRKPLFYSLVRMALAGIFIGSGVVKLADPDAFATVIDAFGILPPVLVGAAALGLPILEVAAGIGLLFDLRGSLGVITLLMVVFIVILGYGIYLGLDVDCGCFGPGDPEAEAFHGLRPALYRDIIMLAGIVYLYAWRHAGGYHPIRVKEMLKGK